MDDEDGGVGEPREEYEEEVEEEGDDDEVESVHSGDEGGAAAGLSEEEEESEEEADGMPEKLSNKKLMFLFLRGQAESRQLQAQTNKLIAQMLNRRPDPGPVHAAFRPPPAPGGHGSAPPADPTALPLDGSTKLFGPGFRGKVEKTIGTTWFRTVGVTSTTLPYAKAAPLAMGTCGLDATDPDTRTAFDQNFKSELSRVGSKAKQKMTGIFVDQLLTLNQLPSITDAGSANPPNIIIHQAPFDALYKPPPAFSAADPRYKYFNAWHAGVNPQTNELEAFWTPTSRKLLQTDFFSRCADKDILPQAAHKWNLGSLAFFLLFTGQRLKMRRGVGGSLAYGNLKDDSTAISEVEKICEWLMDPVACPTTWQPLLTIRNENPHYGVAQPTVA